MNPGHLHPQIRPTGMPLPAEANWAVPQTRYDEHTRRQACLASARRTELRSRSARWPSGARLGPMGFGKLGGCVGRKWRADVQGMLRRNCDYEAIRRRSRLSAWAGAPTIFRTAPAQETRERHLSRALRCALALEATMPRHPGNGLSPAAP